MWTKKVDQWRNDKKNLKKIVIPFWYWEEQKKRSLEDLLKKMISQVYEKNTLFFLLINK